MKKLNFYISRLKENKSKTQQFYNKIENMKSPHLRDRVTTLERLGIVKDYYLYQEQKNFENYFKYMSYSDAYEDKILLKKQVPALEKIKK